MKNWKHWAFVAVIAIFTIGFIGCKEDEPTGEQPQKQPDITRTLSFGTEEKPCTAIIKSDDQFTADEWKTLCDKVVGAVERGYNSTYMPLLNQSVFKAIFAGNISIVLLKSATYDCEVKSGNYT